MTKQTKAFTLTELLIVVIILAVAATFAIPSYEKAVERAKDKEALVTVRILYEASRAWHLQNLPRYFPGGGTGTTDIAVINSGLHLALTPSTDWLYVLSDDPTSPPVQAIYQSTDSSLLRNWDVDRNGIVTCNRQGDMTYSCPTPSEIINM